jgi:hypothetical protein
MYLRREGGVTARCIAILPPTRIQVPPPVSVEGFEHSTACARGTCVAKLRYTLKKSMLPVGIEPNILRLKAGHPEPLDDGSIHSTHGWMRTTIKAINNRALYRLSYMGIGSLSRVDSNHDLRIQRPALLPVELRLSSGRRIRTSNFSVQSRAFYRS